MPTNLLSSLMSRAGGWRSLPSPQREGEQKDPNLDVLKNIANKALEEGNTERIQALSPKLQEVGLDPNIWLTAAGIKTPEQQAQESFETQLAEDFERIQAGAMAPPPDEGNPRTPVFDDSTLLRMAIKKYSGIDIGQNYLENDQWYRDFGTLREKGIPVSTAINQLAVEYGFVPDDASNISDLSTEERQVIFSKSFGNMMDDSNIEGVLSQVYPNAVDNQTGLLDPKVKAGVILNHLSKEGMLVPERYQPFLDRFRGLSTPENVVGKEEAQWLYATKGILPDAATPDDLAKARKVIRTENILNSVKQAALSEEAKTRVKFRIEREKPISASDRAKYGIGSTIKTYEQLADEGYRFPTDYDRKQHDTFSATRTDMLAMESMLFGKGGVKAPSEEGIFTGIGDDLIKRKTSQTGIMKDVAVGNPRGQNYEMYNDAIAAMARRLLALAGESGGRFTDVDVAQIVRSAPDVGGLFGAPDSQTVAQDKYERFIIKLNQELSELEENVILKPIGAPDEPNIAPAGTQARLPNGTIVTSDGEGGWK